MEAAGAASLSVGPLARGERRAAEAVLARAFRDNPLNVAVIGRDPDRRLRANLHGARALLPVAMTDGFVLVARDGSAARGLLIATPPFGWPLRPPTVFEQLRRVLGQGLRVPRRWGIVFDALARIHPREPHWYLATLGVDPPAQRRGVGSALLDRWLAEVDADAAPAWLETDRSANVGFYQRAGFEVARDAEVFGTRVWCMARPGRAPTPR